MYFALTRAMKSRFITELRRFWATHPRYRDIVDNIQGKFSFEGRPQYGIVVKTGSGNRVDLAADNFIGTVNSHVFLSRVQGKPGMSIEWVREDARAIQDAGGSFPSPPGAYFVEMTADDEFWVHPMLDVKDEIVNLETETSALLANPVYPGTLRLIEVPSGYMLQQGEHFQIDLETGRITLSAPISGGRGLIASYRTPAEPRGPFKVGPADSVEHRAIPGVELLFGTRAEAGDVMSVVVQEARMPAHLEYGGQWELQIDVDVLARDPDVQEIIADMSVVYLFGILRSHLSNEGIEILSVELGGESEEPSDENGDDYFYTSTFNMTVRTDWRVAVPLGPALRQIAPLTFEQAAAVAASSDPIQGDGIQALASMGLEAVTDPFFVGRNATFETIS